jgi:hypothetical protein
MKTTSELQPGDIIFSCDFDSDYDDEVPVTPDEVADSIERSVVIGHSTGLRLARLTDNTHMTSDTITGNPVPAVYLYGVGGPDTRHAETEAEAMEMHAEWLEKAARVQAADAAVLRKLTGCETTTDRVIENPASRQGRTR